MNYPDKLYYGLVVKLISATLGLAVFGIGASLALFTDQYEDNEVILILSVVSLSQVILLNEVLLSEYLVQEEGIVISKFCQQEKLVLWKDVVEFYDSDYLQCFILKTKDQKKYRFSYLLNGIDDLIQYIESNLKLQK